MITEYHYLEELKNIEKNSPSNFGDSVSHTTLKECMRRGWATIEPDGRVCITVAGGTLLHSPLVQEFLTLHSRNVFLQEENRDLRDSNLVLLDAAVRNQPHTIWKERPKCNSTAPIEASGDQAVASRVSSTFSKEGDPMKRPEQPIYSPQMITIRYEIQPGDSLLTVLNYFIAGRFVLDADDILKLASQIYAVQNQDYQNTCVDSRGLSCPAAETFELTRLETDNEYRYRIEEYEEQLKKYEEWRAKLSKKTVAPPQRTAQMIDNERKEQLAILKETEEKFKSAMATLDALNQELATHRTPAP